MKKEKEREKLLHQKDVAHILVKGDLMPLLVYYRYREKSKRFEESLKGER